MLFILCVETQITTPTPQHSPAKSCHTGRFCVNSAEAHLSSYLLFAPLLCVCVQVLVCTVGQIDTQRCCKLLIEKRQQCNQVTKSHACTLIGWGLYTTTQRCAQFLDYHDFKAAASLKLQGNFCLRASKLMLAVAWDSLGNNFAEAICVGSHFILFVVALSFKSSFNWDKTVAGKVAAATGSSHLELELTDGVACQLLLLAEACQRSKAVAEKCSAGRPI